MICVLFSLKIDLTAKYDNNDEKYFDVEEKELILKCDGATKLSWYVIIMDIFFTLLLSYLFGKSINQSIIVASVKGRRMAPM